MDKSTVGKLGEDIACNYLKQKSYRILARNYRRKWGEIDIVAEAPDKTLVFVEVKTMIAGDSKESLVPEDQMTRAKVTKFKRIAQTLAISHPNLIHEDKGWRMDLLAISLDKLERKEPNFVVTHYENI